MCGKSIGGTGAKGLEIEVIDGGGKLSSLNARVFDRALEDSEWKSENRFLIRKTEGKLTEGSNYEFNVSHNNQGIKKCERR